MLYPRKLLPQLKKQIKSKEIIVLTGMRRTGKTTLYKMVFEHIKSNNKVFFDLENPIEQKIFEEKDYNNILFNLKEFGIDPRKKSYIFLDEIQAMPQITKAVKYLYDHYDIKFFLTGSSSFYLKNLFPESLAGRKFVFEIFPLDFEEFLVFKNKQKESFKTFGQKDKHKNKIRYEKLKNDYREYLEFGGFPEVVLSSDRDDKKLRLNDIFKSYFEKDIRVLADFKNIKVFRDLILLLMQRIGSKLEISKLASEIGVSRETVYSFLSFLEATYFVHFIRPFSRNVDREISGGRKVYLCDNGFLNNFSRVPEGVLFENAVFLNLKTYGKINYYQKRTGAEIDFIVNKTALETKIKGTEFDIKRLKKTAELIDFKKYYLITRDFIEKEKFIPAIEL